jgi:membrane fusion protein (multidrug efflux system)
MNKKVWLKTLLLCAAIFSALTLFKVMEIRAAIAFGESFPEHSETVKSMKAKTATYAHMTEVLGEVKAPQKVTLLSEVPGRITKVNFTSGQTVAKDQLLVQLDISEENAQLTAAKAKLTLATSIHQRNQTLIKRKAISQERFDKSYADVATLEADIARINAVIRKKTIKAPFTGKVGLHALQVGQFILDGVTITNIVGNTATQWVEFRLPETYPVLYQGDTINVSLLTTDQTFTAKVIASSALIDDADRSLAYRAQLNGTNLADQSSVRVHVPLSSPAELIELPLTAIQQDSSGSFVYRLDADETNHGFRATRIPVKLTSNDGITAFITDGVEAGEHIATDGAFKLFPGVLTFTGNEETAK